MSRAPFSLSNNDDKIISPQHPLSHLHPLAMMSLWFKIDFSFMMEITVIIINRRESPERHELRACVDDNFADKPLKWKRSGDLSAAPKIKVHPPVLTTLTVRIKRGRRCKKRIML